MCQGFDYCLRALQLLPWFESCFSFFFFNKSTYYKTARALQADRQDSWWSERPKEAPVVNTKQDPRRV